MKKIKTFKKSSSLYWNNRLPTYNFFTRKVFVIISPMLLSSKKVTFAEKPQLKKKVYRD